MTKGTFNNYMDTFKSLVSRATIEFSKGNSDMGDYYLEQAWAEADNCWDHICDDVYWKE